ncbi:Kin17-mid domain-containing protein [Mycena indigotica]|uniref:Kin17-mid domain-containing protein n=1 Tax=Mycena indigotica TaxID=2126181 RepID=A0A8H6SGK5_9AGAR|nr:Kin17-mid domain-containing protein [Mycena indigotica]KAF7299173.1 Kin17-mid domain-containing protein [Mycena indigotica]
MPRAEVGTPKYVANKMKSKGLQRLRWYCQVCEKQCRDENGFKCHAQSESHLRQMLVVGENAGRHINNFSQEFQSEFVRLLSRRFGTKRVRANQVYQEYISDKNHLHMNATRWVTLTEFIKHLGRAGIARVDETEKGWFIAWVDNSPKALAKQEASLKKDRAAMSDEQRERILIAEQITRAKAEETETAGPSTASSSSSTTPVEDKELKRDEGEKLVLSFSAKAAPAPVAVAPTLSFKANPLKANPLKPNPLKRPNVFKAGTTPSESSNDKKRPAGLSVAEQLILEDQERKRRRLE